MSHKRNSKKNKKRRNVRKGNKPRITKDGVPGNVYRFFKKERNETNNKPGGLQDNKK